MLSQPSSDSGARVRGGSFVSPRNPELEKFQSASSALKDQQKLERIAIAAMLSLSVSAITAPILFGKSIPLPVRTAMLAFSTIASAATWASASIMQKKKPIYAALDKAQKHAVNLEFETGVAGMETLARVKGAIATHENILRLVPQQYQAFALKQANLSDVRQVEAVPASMPMTLPMPPSMAEIQSSYEAAIAVNPGSGRSLFSPDAQQLQDTLNPKPATRDLSIEIADFDGHIGYVCKTRSGKTTSMIQSIMRSLSQGKHVIVIDGKGDARLKSLPVEYVHANHKSKIPAVFATMKAILKELTHRQDTGEIGQPIDIYIDEYNMILTTAKHLGKIEDDDRMIAADALWAEMNEDIVLQGAAAGIRFRGSNHTSRCENWGWNSGVLDSISFVALGRKGAYESIEDLIKYQVSDRLKPQMKDDLERYRSMDFGEAPLILSMLHPMGFCLLPTTAPAAPNFQAVDGRSPGATPTGKSAIARPLPNTKDWYEDIKQWLLLQPALPTDEAIKSKWQELTGNILNDGGLALLKQNLNLP